MRLLPRLQHPGLTVAGTVQRTPRRMAVIIAVAYLKGPERPLVGAPKGALKMKKFLMKNYGYAEEHISMLLDDGDKNGTNSPTYDNIIKALEDLVRDAEPGDHYFVYYSGHGAQITNLDGREKDGKDEVLLPLNWTTNYGTELFDRDRYQNCIIDDKLNDILVKRLPLGAHLVAFFDCCHSGTMLDLPYSRFYNPNLLDLTSEDLQDIPGQSGASEYNNDSPNPGKGGPYHHNFQSPRPLGSPHVVGVNRRNWAKIRGATDDSITNHPARADVISWSASSDSQETWNHKNEGGILTRTFIKHLTQNPNQTYQELISRLTKDFRKYSEEIKESTFKSSSVGNENADFKHEPQLAFNNPPNMDAQVTL